MNKVLIIEDEQEQLMIFQTVLDMRGLSTRVASTSAEVIIALADDKPDLILSDIMLKGENGLDIIEKIKNDEGMRDVPVFVFTNTNKKDFRDRANELGVVEYIIKSETVPHELAEKIKAFLGVK
ncbi:response regulator [Candidatus Parcubacteria bacterium]|nr:response regulator [Patescibacteria group bacterium]MBU4309822.1 response regulator [Patescibacteria group bacterium]MBU4432230.1 response regulator [Patescibacteria group bacterium]MBU4578161.1 response regulator [Patescibacteria group bacterium]MCG2696698.1 response regulator [Candidatus Parcubacteria bacterium]